MKLPDILWLALGAVLALAAALVWWRAQRRRVAEHRASAAARQAAAQQATDKAQARVVQRRAGERAAQVEAQARSKAQAQAQADAEARARKDSQAREEASANAEAQTAALRAEAEHRAFRAQQAAAQHAAAQVARQAAEALALRPRTPEETLVMVADDSKVVRIKTSRLLARHRYRVVLAEDGLQAAQLIDVEVPVVLITDVEMPGMDGFELTRHVRRHPLAGHIPIIMITSADDRLKAAAAAAGVTLVLGKPYAEDALIAGIEAAQALKPAIA